MATLRYVLVDVFTAQPLTGNPLAVFLDPVGLTQKEMQALARELNLSETTFVLPPENGGTAKVRIFTPRAEIPFAGHPTLGTALVLGEQLEHRDLALELGVGHVAVCLEREAGRVVGGWFSRPAPKPVHFTAGAELLVALGLEQSVTPVVVYDNGMRHAVVHVATPPALDELRPNLNALAQLPIDTVDVFASNGISATLRVFAPAHGVPEDPATGSAAAPVLCHLVEHAGFSRQATLTIHQGACLARPSRIQVRHATDTSGTSPMLEVGGRGVVVAEGVFRLPGIGHA